MHRGRLHGSGTGQRLAPPDPKKAVLELRRRLRGERMAPVIGGRAVGDALPLPTADRKVEAVIATCLARLNAGPATATPLVTSKSYKRAVMVIEALAQAGFKVVRS